MTKSDIDNRSGQLDPLQHKYLDSRRHDVKQEQVMTMVKAEVNAFGRIRKGSAAAEAQSIFDTQ